MNNTEITNRSAGQHLAPGDSPFEVVSARLWTCAVDIDQWEAHVTRLLPAASKIVKVLEAHAVDSVCELPGPVRRLDDTLKWLAATRWAPVLLPEGCHGPDVSRPFYVYAARYTGKIANLWERPRNGMPER